jgi:cytochrome b561
MIGSTTRYDAITILLHWGTALLVVTLFGLAEFWGFLPRGTPLRHEVQGLHISLGLALAAVLALRIAWRLGFGRTLPEIESTLPYWAAKSVHYLLYILLIVQVALGFLFRWAQGEAFTFFGLFTIPSAFAADKSLARTIGEAHDLAGWGIVLLAGLHAAAALFHHYALRDGTIKRMLPY